MTIFSPVYYVALCQLGINDHVAYVILCYRLQLKIQYIATLIRLIIVGILLSKRGKGSPYSITERRVPKLIPVLGSQPAGDVSHKPGGRLPLLSARPAVTPATLKTAATNFAAW